jgi:hypothetical protein
VTEPPRIGVVMVLLVLAALVVLGTVLALLP